MPGGVDAHIVRVYDRTAATADLRFAELAVVEELADDRHRSSLDGEQRRG
jgi:hypothetical protein